MDNEHTIRRGPTPMLEIIITTGIFISISVLILRIFFGANKLQERGTNITQSMIYSEAVAERIKGSASYDLDLEELGMVLVEEDGEPLYQKYYNQDWMEVDTPDTYLLQVKRVHVERQYGKLNTYIIEVMDEDRTWCKLSVKRYL